jgi:hypothetical protein
MLFSSWLRNENGSLERRSALNQTRRRRPPLRHVAPRLRLEALEDRTLLSPVLTVTNLAVSGSNGAVVSNSGTFADTTARASVTLTASTGTVVQNSNGTWIWSETTPAGAAQTAPMTISATDSNGQTAQSEFWLNVGQVFTVTNTGDNGGVNPAAGAGTGTLRQAIVDANNASGSGEPSLIAYNLPAADPRHFYYKDNGTPGVSLADVATTTATNDSQITDIDPDYAHSWWSIQPVTPLPTTTEPVVIDGYSQPGAQVNTIPMIGELSNGKMVYGDNAVLRIELDGHQPGTNNLGSGNGLVIDLTNSQVRDAGGDLVRSSTVRGLNINGFAGNDLTLTNNQNSVVAGNFLGTDISGTVAPNGTNENSPFPFKPIITHPEWPRVPLTTYGVSFSGGSGNLVGAAGDGVDDVGARNVISAVNVGVACVNSDITVAGNFIGTDSSGMQRLGNFIGIGFSAPSEAVIGRAGGGLDDINRTNLISGNYAGVVMTGSSVATQEVHGIQVSGNLIGTDATGQGPLGNDTGIDINASSDNQIGANGGGVNTALGNTIAFNHEAAVLVNDNNGNLSVHNVIRANSIHDNWLDYQGTGAAIDLFGTIYPQWVSSDGSGNSPIPLLLFPPSPPSSPPPPPLPPLPAPYLPVPNDSQGHSGSNNFENYPILTSVISSQADTSITGTFSSGTANGVPYAPNIKFRLLLDFYASPTKDPSGYGEGQTYLGWTLVDTDSSGNVSFTADLAVGNLAGRWITATATDAQNGNTSEFALDMQATAAPSQTYAQYLQAALPQSSTTGNSMTIQASASLTPATVIAAVNGLTNVTQPVTIYLDLGGGRYSPGVTYNPTDPNTRANVYFVFINGTLDPNYPALTVAGGQVAVRNCALTTTGNAPTLLVNGGNVTLRNDIIQESTGATEAAIAITGGTLDLGTASSPGDNTLNVNGSGELVSNTTGNAISAVGDTFQVNGTVLPAPSLSFTALSSSVPVSVFGQPVTLTANVVANTAGLGTPTGSVDFLDSTTNTDLGSTPLSGGIASLSTASLAAGNHAIRATYSGDSNFTPSLDTQTQAVNPATPMVTVTDAGGTYNGQPFAATATVAGVVAGKDSTPSASLEGVSPTLTYYSGTYTSVAQLAGITLLAGAPTDAGAYTVLASFGGSTDYTSATALANFTISKANQTITWATPASIFDGTALSGTQLDATVSVIGPAPAGTLTYSPAAGTVLGPGLQNLTVTAAATNDYNAATASVVLPVKYAFSGFLPPLSKSLVFAVNRTIPIKFTLSDANGNAITSLSAVTSLQIQALDVNGNPAGAPFTPASTNSQGLQYNGGQYQFNWQTKGLAAGSYQIVLKLADGTTQTKTIQLTAGGSSAGLVTGSSGGTTTAGALLGGEVDLYVDNSNGDLSSDELARIQDAITSIDATIAPYGVTIIEVSDPTQANVTLNMNTTSALGGVAQGVLGCTTDADQVTMIQGWNWYAGSDPTRIAAGQYDFETAVMHELGHVLGLGHSSNTTSVMYAMLATGSTDRALTKADLSVPDDSSGPCALQAGVIASVSASNRTPAGSVGIPGSDPFSAVDQLLSSANLAHLLTDMLHAYQAELSSLLALWQRADALFVQRYDALLSMGNGALSKSLLPAPAQAGMASSLPTLDPWFTAGEDSP